MIEKRLIMSERVREVPTGFGWVDHRLMRNGFLHRCSPESLALYLALVCVSDAEGMSYWGDRLLCSTLGFTQPGLAEARSGLVKADLIAWDPPLYQVLELPGPGDMAAVLSSAPCGVCHD